jgi:hypothetical protein
LRKFRAQRLLRHLRPRKTNGSEAGRIAINDRTRGAKVRQKRREQVKKRSGSEKLLRLLMLNLAGDQPKRKSPLVRKSSRPLALRARLVERRTLRRARARRNVK